jgi:hypothetical protein
MLWLKYELLARSERVKIALFSRYLNLKNREEAERIEKRTQARKNKIQLALEQNLKISTNQALTK